MIISTEKNFVFVHIYKTGGSSMKVALMPYANKKLSNGRYGHATARDVQYYLEQDGLDINDFHTFCVVRNPFEWHQSLFSYIRESAWHPDHELFNTMSFREYVYWLRDEGMKRGKYIYDGSLTEVGYHTFQEYIKDENGKVMIDQIIKLEELKEKFPELCKKLDLDEIELPHKNKGSYGVDVTYTDDTRKIIKELHREDIKMFGYGG